MRFPKSLRGPASALTLVSTLGAPESRGEEESPISDQTTEVSHGVSSLLCSHNALRIHNFQMLPGDRCSFEWNGVIGKTYRIEMSGDLENWEEAEEPQEVESNEDCFCVVEGLENFDRYFFRIVELDSPETESTPILSDDDFLNFVDSFYTALSSGEQKDFLSGDLVLEEDPNLEMSLADKQLEIQNEIDDIPREINRLQILDRYRVQQINSQRYDLATIRALEIWFPGENYGAEMGHFLNTAPLRNSRDIELQNLGGYLVEKDSAHWAAEADRLREVLDAQWDTFVVDKDLYDRRMNLAFQENPSVELGLLFSQMQSLSSIQKQLETQKNQELPWQQEVENFIRVSENLTYLDTWENFLYNDFLVRYPSASSSSISSAKHTFFDQQRRLIQQVHNSFNDHQLNEYWGALLSSRTSYREDIAETLRRLVYAAHESMVAGYENMATAQGFVRNPMEVEADRNFYREKIEILQKAQTDYGESIDSALLEILAYKESHRLWTLEFYKWQNQDPYNRGACPVFEEESLNSLFKTIEKKHNDALFLSTLKAQTHLDVKRQSLYGDPEDTLQSMLGTLQYFASPEGRQITNSQNHADTYDLFVSGGYFYEKYKNDPRFFNYDGQISSYLVARAQSGFYPSLEQPEPEGFLNGAPINDYVSTDVTYVIDEAADRPDVLEADFINIAVTSLGAEVRSASYDIEDLEISLETLENQEYREAIERNIAAGRDPFSRLGYQPLVAGPLFGVGDVSGSLMEYAEENPRILNTIILESRIEIDENEAHYLDNKDIEALEDSLEILRNGNSFSEDITNYLSVDLVRRLYRAEWSRMSLNEKWAVCWNFYFIDVGTIGVAQLSEGLYQDVRNKPEFEEFIQNRGMVLTNNYRKDLTRYPDLESFVVLAGLAIKIDEREKEGRDFIDQVKFGIGFYHGADKTLVRYQLQTSDILDFDLTADLIYQEGTRNEMDIINYINEITQ